MKKLAQRLQHFQNLSAREFRTGDNSPFLDDILLLEAHNEGMVNLSLAQKQRLFVLSKMVATVYFIAAVDAGKIKIGRTRNISKRLSALETSSPVPLTLMHTVQYDDELEQRIHQHLGKYRSHGEWFHADKPVVEFVRNAKKEGIPWLVSQVGDAAPRWMAYTDSDHARHVASVNELTH